MSAPAITPDRWEATEAPDDLTDQRVLPRRHVGRWISTAIALVLLVELAINIAHNDTYQWHLFWGYFTRPYILQGVLLTVQLTVYAAILGLVLGIVLAIARLSQNQLFNSLAWLYIWFFRSLPIPVLLIILFNLTSFFPVLGIQVPFGPTLFAQDTQAFLVPLTAGVLGLAINEAAYAAELIRGGIVSVDQGQVEAANALGLSPARRLRRVVLPQALRAIVPGYVNQLIGLVKASSLVYYVSLIDVFGAVFVLESRYPADIVPILLAGSAWYLVIAAVLSVVQFYVERFYARGALRTVPLTPTQRLLGAVGSLRIRGREVR